MATASCPHPAPLQGWPPCTFAINGFPYPRQHVHGSLMKTVPRSDSWCKVSTTLPLAKHETAVPQPTPPRASHSSSSSSLYAPSVLSFSSFVYVGKAVPPFSSHPVFSTGVVNPFLGILMFNHSKVSKDQRLPSINSEDTKEHNTPPTSSEKIDHPILEGNEVDPEYDYEGREYNNGKECNEMMQQKEEEEDGQGQCEEEWEQDQEDEEETEDEEWNDENETVSSGEDSWDSADDTSDVDDCDSVVDFDPSLCSLTLKSECPLLAPPPSIPLSHTFSFSSEESGYCEPSHCEWAEDNDDLDNVLDCNEGLWHVFERQACFTGIPWKSTTTTHKTHKQTRSSDSLTVCLQQRVTLNQLPLHADLIASSETYQKTQKQFVVLPTNDNNVTSNSSITALASSSTTAAGRKKVSFKPDSELVTVHHMVVWKYAYRACRKGLWEQYAADRERFHKRIQAVDHILAPCLVNKISLQHRSQ